MKFGLIPPMLIAITVLVFSGCSRDLERYGVELDETNVLHGMDENGNGLRDDIDLYISKHFKSQSEKSAVRLLALSYQKALTVDKDSIASVHAVAGQYSRAMDCVFRAFPDARLPDGTTLPLILKSMIVNTTQRRTEYSIYTDALKGYVTQYLKVSPVVNSVNHLMIIRL